MGCMCQWFWKGMISFLFGVARWPHLQVTASMCGAVLCLECSTQPLQSTLPNLVWLSELFLRVVLSTCQQACSVVTMGWCAWRGGSAAWRTTLREQACWCPPAGPDDMQQVSCSQ